MSLESEQMLGRATVGKSKNPVRITRKREKHPQAGWRPALSGPGTGPHENGSGTSRLLQSSEHLEWSPSLGEESRGRAELYPRDLHWATGSSPTDPITLQRCRSHWELLAFGSRLFSLPGMFSSNCLCLPGRSLNPGDLVWGHLFQEVFLD